MNVGTVVLAVYQRTSQLLVSFRTEQVTCEKSLCACWQVAATVFRLATKEPR